MPKFLTIPVDDSDTEGHAAEYEFTPEDGDDWLDQLARRDPKGAPVRIRLADDDDAEGHIARVPRLHLVIESDDDTEGHAISMHFPSVDEADRFRRRLLATGVLVGAIALGATTGALLSERAQPGAADAGTVSAERVTGEYAADRGIGVAPAAAGTVSAEGVTGEYAADRGIGVAPEAADTDESLSGNPNRDVMPR